jgi:ATP-binding cassette, subfamily F, member 3
MISVDNLSKGFGDHILLDDISFKINRHERVGLVGRNGHGKTTLFRILAELEAPDAGRISVPKNYRIGYVRQDVHLTEKTVFEEAVKSLPEADPSHYWKAEKALFGLGFCPADLKQPPQALSGGFQVRLNLTKVLLSDPDLLLLDEPTNYLDITAIRWIRRYLQDWPRELFMITHDRGLMDQVVTHIIGIHRQKTRKIAGDTGKYYMQVAQTEEVYERSRINEARRRKEIEAFIARFRAKARLAGLVQSRIKTLNRQSGRKKLQKFKTLDFSFRSKPFAGKYMMSVTDLCFFYAGKRPLISNFNITIAPRDRICVIGQNGAGKTTLLKLFSGFLSPESGCISDHPETVKGYFEQTHVSSLVDTRSVEEEILFSVPGVDRQLARDICGAMLFEGDAALKKIGVLSGGEKSRVMLGKLLCTPINLLLLDEPSNHFDMESCDALLSAIDRFEGAVVMVTHNEMFLHAIAERLIVFQGNRLRVFEGDYQRFLDGGGWGDENPSEGAVDTGCDPETENRATKKGIRRLRSAVIAERSRALKPMEERITALETRIDEYESRLKGLVERMQVATMKKDGRGIAELSQAIHRCQADIDVAFDELILLSEHAEEKRRSYEARLNALEATAPS